MSSSSQHSQQGHSEQHQVRHLQIDAEQAGQRVDNFLLSQLKGVPKSRIYRILRKGEVRVNKKRVKPTYRLQSGDLLRIPPVRVSAPSEAPEKHRVQWMEEAILYEDEVILVLNKPSGIAVHGGSGIQFGVIEGIRALREHSDHYELVHRIDRATSGLLIIAKKRSALRFLHQVIREQGMEKRYLALVAGKMRKSRTINASLKKSVLRSGERMVTVDPQGKEAESRFLPRLSCPTATLAEVEIVTGRTHQIRVHGTHIDHPLAGDERYGDMEFNQQMKKRGLNRLFLHAYQLAFPHPVDGTTVRLEAPLPNTLVKVVDHLKEEGGCKTL